MNFILILFVTTASCAILPTYDNDYVILPEHLNLYNRDKRDVVIHKDGDDKYSVDFNKNLIKDADKKLSVFGMLEGLNKNGYDTIKTGLDFKNAKGDSLDLSALNSKTETKILGRGELNIFKTDAQTLNAKAFAEKNLLNEDSLYKYGGNLDYINNKGDSLSLTALNSNKDQKYSALGNLNLFNTDTQSLDLEAYGEKTSNGKGEHSKFGGNLDYTNINGHGLHLTAQKDSDLGTELTGKGKYVIMDKPDYTLNAQGYWKEIIPKTGSPIENYGANLNYLNKYGDTASLFAKHIPNLGDELAASGKYNVFHNNNHNLDLTGKVSRLFPSDPNIGAYNSYSANLDYLYKDKLSANLGVEHSGLFGRTDISALGKLNLIDDKNTHLNIFGGVSRSMSPKFDSGFQPNFGLELETKF